MALEVELPAYDGPLDLLLGLIEKNRISIFDIPIVTITDQYLAYVSRMPREDLDTMSEFMVMAAELISIKCRMLLPKEETAEEEETDPREELVRRLLEYKTCKYVSGQLRGRMAEAEKHLYKMDTTPPEVRKYRPEVDAAEVLDGLTMERLHDVFRSVLRRETDKIDPMRSSFGKIEREEVSLPETLERVTEYVASHKTCSFRELLMNQKSRTQVVVTFLVVLELISYGFIGVRQDLPEDDIAIVRNPNMSLENVRERFGEIESREEGVS